MTKSKIHIASGVIAIISVICYIMGHILAVSQFNMLNIMIVLRVFENVIYKVPFIIACFFFDGKIVGKILTAITFGYMVLGQVVTLVNGVNLPYMVETVFLIFGSAVLVAGCFKRIKGLDIFAFFAFAVCIILDIVEYWGFLSHGVNIKIIAVFYSMFTFERVLFFLSAGVFLLRKSDFIQREELNKRQALEARLDELLRLYREGEISEADYEQRKKEITDLL